MAALLTTVTRDYDRVSMHGVRRALLERQAESLGRPLRQVLIPKGASNEEYEREMAAAFSEYREGGIDQVVFGDLFLEDVRAYREQFLARHGMRGLYPVWMSDTGEFVREFIALGLRAVVTCVNSEALDGSFAGRLIDEEFLASLRSGVEPMRRERRVPLLRLRWAVIQGRGQIHRRGTGLQRPLLVLRLGSRGLKLREFGISGLRKRAATAL